jgi:hypothetical protein
MLQFSNVICDWLPSSRSPDMADLEALLSSQLEDFKTHHELIGTTDPASILQNLDLAGREALAEGLAKGRWLLNGKLLHSERDAGREASRAAEAFGSARALVCVSAGAGYILRHLPSTVRAVLIIEPSPFCIAAILLAGEFKKCHARITLVADTLVAADALENILPWLQGKNLKQTIVYVHPAARAAAPSLYTRAYERVVQLFEKRSVNQATIVKFQRLWNKNIFLNQRVMPRAGTLNDLLQTSVPEAIVLAGAGPSLASSFGQLKEHRSRFLLMAADTAVVPLAKAGIYPDLAFAADPQWVNHHFAETADAARAAWVMDPVVCPQIPRSLADRGAKLFFWNNVFLSDRLLRKVDRGDVAHGGSVSTNAFDIALRWLGNRVDASAPARLILVGQDLSFPNRQAHCKGAVLEAQVYARSHRLNAMEQHNLRQMRALPVLWVKGIRQPKVATNAKLKIFLEWFAARAAEKNERVRLINATHDGAEIAGFEHVDLPTALTGVEPHENPVGKIAPRGQGQVRDISHLIEDFTTIIRIMRENENLSRVQMPDQKTVQKLNANDAAFKNLKQAKDIAALAQQALILKITEQGEEVNAPEFYRAMAQAAREARHWARKVFSA